jgi:ribose-phosphate pyrophosphokinase
MDVHNLSALQNAFRVPTDNLESKNLLADWTAGNVTDPENLVVLSPDSGGMGRSKRFRNTLKEKLKVEVPLAYLDKTHTGRLIQGHSIIGSVKDKDVVILDDMISSGSTIRESYNAVLAHGGRVFAAEATHGLFVGKVNENLNGVERVVITDTIDSAPRVSKDVQQKLHIISTSRMFSQAIRRIHEEGGSISDLLK